MEMWVARRSETPPVALRPWLPFGRAPPQSDFDRQLYRITLVGEKLTGVDGKMSRSIEGLPILSAAEELKMVAE